MAGGQLTEVVSLIGLLCKYGERAPDTCLLLSKSNSL
jgi:hypothetical protein